MAFPPQSMMQSPMTPRTPQNQSVEQQGLAGGGVDNKQQVSNFLSALNQVGAGGNNTQMGYASPQQPGVGPMLNPQIASLNNGAAANNTFTPGGYQPGGQLMAGSQTQGANMANYGGGTVMSGPNQYGSVIAATDTLPGGTAGAGSPLNQPWLPQPTNSAQAGGYNGMANPGSGVQLPHAAPNYGPALGGLATDPSLAAPGGLAGAGTMTSLPHTMGAVSGAPPPVGGTFGNVTLGGQTAQPPYFTAQNLPTTLPINPGTLVSDERAKTAIAPATDKLRAFMDAIHAHAYQYKDPRDGVGTFTSPMAQELERTDLGKQAVINTPRGKMVDYARLGGVNLAAVSVVHREQERLRKEVDALRGALRKRVR